MPVHFQDKQLLRASRRFSPQALSSTMADVETFLKSIGLGKYAATFADEEITEVALLRSMGEDMLRESMEELGMELPHVNTLTKALFGGSGGAERLAEDEYVAEVELRPRAQVVDQREH